jgi:hypothetical protein
MRIAADEHLAKHWRIHDIAAPLRLEDVWALPAWGDADDFGAFVAMMAHSDPVHADSQATRFLWAARDRIGAAFGLGRIASPAAEAGGALPIPGSSQTSLAPRVPADLQGSADDIRFEHLPFVSLYRTTDEYAGEVSNRTVHGVIHLAWVNKGDRFQAQMAVYVKPRGLLGEAYMALIRPFRYWLVYPALERQYGRTWRHRHSASDSNTESRSRRGQSPSS